MIRALAIIGVLAGIGSASADAVPEAGSRSPAAMSVLQRPRSPISSPEST